MYNCTQSHYIEVAQGGISMEHKMRFGLVLGRMAILKKKIGGRIILRVVFSCLQEQKNNLNLKKNILASALKSWIK